LPKDYPTPDYSPWRLLTKGDGPVVITVGPLAGLYISAFNEMPMSQRPNLWVVSELPISLNPVPLELIDQVKRSKDLFVVEEHVRHGGFGSDFLLFLAEKNIRINAFHHLHAKAHHYEKYGSQNYLTDLTSLEELQNRYQLHSPTVNTLVELPIGDRFIQPVVPQPNNYEGELNETGAFITITLPDQINRDPRWQNFADTGLIEARWQGEELVLRGLSQREILQQNSLARRQWKIECCSNCVYFIIINEINRLITFCFIHIYLSA
jgi:hypothetical protein